ASPMGKGLYQGDAFCLDEEARTALDCPKKERTMRVAAVLVGVCTGLVAWPCSVAAQASPQVHELKASPATVHRNFFDASLKPVLTINSGDIVRLETVSGNPRYFENLGVPKERIPQELYAAFEGVEGNGR